MNPVSVRGLERKLMPKNLQIRINRRLVPLQSKVRPPEHSGLIYFPRVDRADPRTVRTTKVHSMAKSWEEAAVLTAYQQVALEA